MSPAGVAIPTGAAPGSADAARLRDKFGDKKLLPESFRADLSLVSPKLPGASGNGLELAESFGSSIDLHDACAEEVGLTGGIELSAEEGGVGFVKAVVQEFLERVGQDCELGVRGREVADEGGLAAGVCS